MRNPSCDACPLAQRACTICVWGEGPPQADLMIVGMAPGSTEDVRGRPFVGPAGEVLNDLLAQAGLARAEIYITNAVKCYPGKGKPGRKDIGTCTELYLKGEIESVRPKLIVAMGDLSMLSLTNRSGVKANRGTTLELRAGLGGGIPVLVTYHPAAFLHSHDPKIKEAIRADLETAKAILEGKGLSLEVRRSVHEDSGALGAIVAVDVETGQEGSLVVGTLATADGEYLRFHREGVLRLFADLPARRLVAWNAKFDREVLAREGVDVDRFEWSDPMLMLHLLDSGRQGRYNLAAAVLDEFGWADREWLESKRAVHGGEEIPLERLTRYCAQDATYTMMLYERYRERLLKMPKAAKLYKTLVVPASFMLAETEKVPVPLDMAYLEQLDEDFTRDIRRLEEELRELAGLETTPNFRSPKMLAEVMYQRLGLPIVKVTETGQPSTDKSVLMELMQLSPFVVRLMRHRKFSKLHSSYVKRWLNKYSSTPYYVSTNQTGTVTGRLANDFQQVPRVSEDPEIPNIKNAVAAPEGFVILEADYSMLELRLGAWWAGEETMLRLLREEGQDIHRHTAEQAFGKGVTGFQRYVGKTMNFLLEYKGGPPKLAETLRLRMTDEQIANLCAMLSVGTLGEASRLLSASWHHTYPGIRQWHWREGGNIEVRGYAVAPHGRIRWLPEARSTNNQQREEAIREGINHVIQSLATDLCLMAGVLAAPTFASLGAQGPWPVHDSLMWVVPAAHVRWLAAHLKRVMEVDAVATMENIMGRTIDVPIVADIKVGPRWGSVELLDLQAVA